MKWIVAVIGTLALLVAGVYAVGLSLPQNHVAVRTARSAQPPETVWAAITDVASFPAWRSALDSVEQLPPRNGIMVWREISGNEGTTYEAEESERPSRLVTRITDRGLPFGGSWEIRITPDGTGSRISITENGEVYNPVFRFVSRFVIGHSATIDKYLSDLAVKLGDAAVSASG